jgi:hypothetical protein
MKFPAFSSTHPFIISFTRPNHYWFISWIRWLVQIPYIFFHLHLDVQGYLTYNFVWISLLSYMLHTHHHILLDLINLIIFGEEYRCINDGFPHCTIFFTLLLATCRFSVCWKPLCSQKSTTVIQNYWICGLCPSSGKVLQTQWFWVLYSMSTKSVRGFEKFWCANKLS